MSSSWLEAARTNKLQRLNVPCDVSGEKSGGENLSEQIYKPADT